MDPSEDPALDVAADLLLLEGSIPAMEEDGTRYWPRKTFRTRGAALVSTAFALLPLLACERSSPDRETPPTWSLVKELQVGSFDDPETSFSDIVGIAVNSAGTAYVAQRVVGEIAVLDYSGRRVGTIGGKGEGPGEFQFLWAMGIISDTVWVSDDGNRRVTFIAADLSIIGDVPFNPAPSLEEGTLFRPMAPSAVFADGSFASITSTFSGHVARGQVTRMPVLRYSQHTELLDTIGWRDCRNENIALLSEDSETFISNPFSDHTLIVPLTDGSGLLFLERSWASGPHVGSFRLVTVHETGDTVSAWSIAYSPVQLDKDLAWELLRKERPGAVEFLEARTPGGAGQSISNQLPPFLPPVTDLVATEDGGAWIRRETEVGDSVWWHRVSAQGRLIAKVRAHRSLKVYAEREGTLWGSELGIGDIPYLVRFRVELP